MRHVLRVILLTLALMMLGLMLTPKATPAQTDPCSPNRPIPYWWHLRPLNPCAGDSVMLVLQSCRECVDLVSWDNPQGGPLSVYARMPEACPAITVCTPDSLVIPLGRFASGSYTSMLRIDAGVVVGDTGYCVVTRNDSLRFTIDCQPPNTLPYVSTLYVGEPGADDAPIICPGRPIPLRVAGFFPNGCYQFTGLELVPHRGSYPGPPLVRIHVAHRTCGVCTMNVPPWSADTVLAGLPTGAYTLQVQLIRDDYCDSLHTTAEYFASRAFTVPTNCTAPPPDSLPFTSEIRIGGPAPCDTCAPVVCPWSPIPLHLAGMLPSWCGWRFEKLELIPVLNGVPLEPPLVRVTVSVNHCVECVPGPPPLPWSADTLLRALAPGRYGLTVQMVVTSACGGGPDSVRSVVVPFAVADTCPQPPPGPLPFTRIIRVGPPPTCETCPPRICPGRPIPFLAAGTLPSTCYRFVGIQLLPSMIVGPRPEPPIVRLVVAFNDCMRWACSDVLMPWGAEALLPALPPGDYHLPVQLAVVSWCDTTRLDTLYSTYVAFTVKDSCAGGPNEPCLSADWDHSGRVGGCDAHVGPGEPATVDMTLQTAVALAGVQGRLHLYPPGLRVTALQPIGPAAGMKIEWTPSPDGARFVMFAESGAPIVPVRCDLGTRCAQGVLAVTLEVPAGAPSVAAVTHVTADSLLGSDSLGVAVPQCPIMTLVVVAAEVCSGRSSCDFNQDGHLDVRDLVTMVHCVIGQDACPDSARLDCNGDGHTGVDDVLCCARQILRGGERDTTGGRPEPGVVVALGEPVWGADGLTLPLRLDGADRVGAARLALALPADRYEVTGVDLGGASAHWLELHEVADGQLVLGLIGLGNGGTPPTQLALTLRLALKPGQSPGGEVSLADAQFSGADGVTLAAPQNSSPVPLTGPQALGLSVPWPNPFPRQTHFTLLLDHASAVEVSIHDLAGRRVATLFRGALAAGQARDFTWNGARDDGSVAPNGIYFVHARVGADRLARRIVFLRGH